MKRLYTIRFVSGRKMVCEAADNNQLDDITMRLTGALPAESVQVRSRDREGPVFVRSSNVESVSWEDI